MSVIEETLALLGDLERAGVEYRIDSGTLLGVVRDGRLLPNDEDVDIAVLADGDRDAAETILPLARRRSNHTITLQTFRGRITKIKLLPRTKSHDTLKIDINLFRRVGAVYCQPAHGRVLTLRDARNWMPGSFFRAARWALFKRLVLPVTKTLPLDASLVESAFELKTWIVPHRYWERKKRIDFFGAPAWAPEEVEEYLTFRYGDWKTPVPDWDFWVDDGGLADFDPGEIFH
jgi:hypothetical protein